VPNPGDKKMLDPCPICGGEQYLLAVQHVNQLFKDYVVWEQRAVHCLAVSRWDETPNFRLCVMELRRRIEALEGRDATTD